MQKSERNPSHGTKMASPTQPPVLSDEEILEEVQRIRLGLISCRRRAELLIQRLAA